MRGKGLPFLVRFLSVSGIPLLGIGALIFCLWHPKVAAVPETIQPSVMLLSKPDPKMDKCRIIFLRQQAREVAFSRKRGHAGSLAQAIFGYNLIAQECTPAVFRATHLPSYLSQ